MKTLKYSRQRESIKKYVMSHNDHPTADTIYMAIREEFPNISLGTVYRNLNLLADLGEISRFDCGDGSEHFDWDVTPHYHFVCRTCGAVMDLPKDIVRGTNELLPDTSLGRVDSHRIFFYGECKDCIRKKNAHND